MEAALSDLPPLVRFTPPNRVSQHAVEADARTGVLSLGAGWQLGTETSIRTSTGMCTLDLSKATWDGPDVDLSLRTATGLITVLVPRGVAVQVRSVKGHLIQKLDDALPGAPVLRVTASAATGMITLCHPSPPRQKRLRFWRRRRSKAPQVG